MDFSSCAVGFSGVASFITMDKQLQENRGNYLPHASGASLGLSLQIKINGSAEKLLNWLKLNIIETNETVLILVAR